MHAVPSHSSFDSSHPMPTSDRMPGSYHLRAVPARDLDSSKAQDTALKTGKFSHYYFTGPNGKRFVAKYQTAEGNRTYTHETTASQWQKIIQPILPTLAEAKGPISFTPVFDEASGQAKAFQIDGSLNSVPLDLEAFTDLESNVSAAPLPTPFQKENPYSSEAESEQFMDGTKTRTPAPEAGIHQDLYKISDRCRYIIGDDADGATDITQIEKLELTGIPVDRNTVIPVKIPQAFGKTAYALLIIGPPRDKKVLYGKTRDIVFYSPTGLTLDSQLQGKTVKKRIESLLETQKIKRYNLKQVKSETIVSAEESRLAVLGFHAETLNQGLSSLTTYNSTSGSRRTIAADLAKAPYDPSKEKPRGKHKKTQKPSPVPSPRLIDESDSDSLRHHYSDSPGPTRSFTPTSYDSPRFSSLSHRPSTGGPSTLPRLQPLPNFNEFDDEPFTGLGSDDAYIAFTRPTSSAHYGAPPRAVDPRGVTGATVEEVQDDDS